jgi:hypothetical protein
MYYPPMMLDCKLFVCYSAAMSEGHFTISKNGVPFATVDANGASECHHPFGWQPIATAPKDGTLVDLWVETTINWRPDGEQFRYIDCFWTDAGWVEIDFHGDVTPVESQHHTATHWMSPPEPPTA